MMTGTRLLLFASLLAAPDPHLCAADASISSGTLAHLLRPELRGIELDIQRLRSVLDRLPELSSGHAGVRRGFHGTYTYIPDKPFWVALDLGKSQPIDAVVLVPAHAIEGSSAITGYGFPARFRIEVSESADFRESRTLADETAHDYPNPGPYPYFAEGGGTPGRYVRLLATKRWRQTERLWVIALAELAVLSHGRNVALGAKVSTLEDRSMEHPPVWSRGNLVDGQSDLGPPTTREPSSSHGYESARASSANTVKWVQIDLTCSLPIDEVHLVPAHPIDYPAPGYGFPLRFRIEIAQDAQFRDYKVIGDYTGQDFLSPGDNVVTVAAKGVRGRYVRVTATRLVNNAETGRYSFALAEVQVISGGENVALGRPVTALDIQNESRQPWHIGAFPQGPVWGLQYIVDGYAGRYRLTGLDTWYRGLYQRGRLTKQLSDLESRCLALREEAAGLVVTLGATITLLLTGGLGGLTWWFQRRRSRQTRELRLRLARDLHDAVGSSLGSIRLTSQVARSAAGALPSVQQDLELIEQIAGETASDMRDIVWLLDDQTVTASELAVRMKSVAEQMLAEREFTLSLKPAPAQELSLEFRRNVLFAFKEALHNAVRHSRAAHIDVEIDGQAGCFAFRVRDNGRGFDPGQPEDGHGLLNLRNRAAVLRGRADIESAPGRGTLVDFRVPVA